MPALAVTEDATEEDAGSSKWIVASQRMPEVITALRTLQKYKLLESLGVVIEDDAAPRSNASKKLHQLMFGKGAGKGAGKTIRGKRR